MKKTITSILILLFAAHIAGAQIKTVIPAIGLSSLNVTNTATDIRFNLGTLPKGYVINSCTLQMVCGQNITGAVGLRILSASNAPLFQTQLKDTCRDTTILKLKIDISNLPLENGILTLKALIKSVDPVSIKFYPSTVNPSPKLGYSPQLIISYSAATPVTEWASMQANSRHTAQSPMKFGGFDVESFGVFSVKNIKAARQNMVIYQDRLYVLSPNEGTISLYAVDPASLVATPMVNTLDASDQSAPVVDAYGRFYYSWSNKIGVIELANNYKRGNGEITLRAKAANAMTIGADGSLYVPTDDNIAAYSPFPQNQLVWEYELGGKKSSVALSKDGTRAYFLSYNRGSKTEGLLTALDANNGTWIANAVIKLDDSSSNVNLPTPVVDNLGYVYITNKLTKPTQLYIFKQNLSPVKTRIIGENISMAAGFADRNRNIQETTFLNAGTIYRYSGIDDTTKSLSTVDVAEVQSLLTDEGNNMYIISGDKFMYKPLTGDNISLTLPAKPDKSMVLGADGTLYTSAGENVIAIKPTRFKNGTYTTDNDDSNADNITIRAQKIIVKDVNDSFTFSNNKILIAPEALTFEPDVTLTNKANVLLKLGKSGSGAVFNNGFRVQQGASLTVKTGY